MQNNTNITNGNMPLGLGMALAQDLDAMKVFSSMSIQQQQSFIDKAHSVSSKKEMKQLISSLNNNGATL
ncbi:MAG: hypothetical protein RSE07_01270 [Oscillospiraceae bacterium]